MKERFSKIFELWNQRNIGFYKECFKKLETENKTSFNYIAGMFPIMWMVFRKMYGWAVIIALILAGVGAAQVALIPSAGTATNIAHFIIEFAIFGFIGNTLYYKHVKSKVAKGYSKMEGYNSIDPIWSVLYVGLSALFSLLITILLSMKGVSLWVSTVIAGIISVLIIAIPWAIDSKKCCSQEVVGTVLVNEESVGRYLEKANSQKMFAAMWVLIACLLAVGVSSVGAKMIGERIKSRLEKIADDLDKMPNDSKKLDDASNNTTEQLNNVSEDINETSEESNVGIEEASKMSDVSDAISEVQNSSIDDQIANLADEIDKTLNDSKNSEITEDSINSKESNENLNTAENSDEPTQDDQDPDQSSDEENEYQD